MAKMLDQIKHSAVPEAVLHSAAQGALALPPVESMEILVHLSADPVFGEQAQTTLANWDIPTCRAILSDPNTPREVLNYFILPKHRRPQLVSALIENRATTEATLLILAETATREEAEALLLSPRVWKLPDVQRALLQNPNLTENERRNIRAKLGVSDKEAMVVDHDVDLWIMEHAAEIAAEEGKAFSLIAGTLGEEFAANGEVIVREITEEELAQAVAAAKAEEKERISTLQRLAKLSVGDRVKVAMTGSKEERAILIRDGSKVVSSAVVASPKASEQEIETFASMKNIQESTLRDIGRNRKFIKDYVVLKNLVTNPRCPLDLSLTLVKKLIVTDLRSLSMSKNVSDTLRKVATKLYKERSTPIGQRTTY